MYSLRFHWILGVVAAMALIGCPSATTRDDDGGPGIDAGRYDDGAIIILDTGSGDASSMTDAGPQPAWNACTATSQCGLAAMSCCAPCGAPSLGQLDAINVSQRDAHFAAVCPAPTPCPACPTGNNANLVASCERGHCTGHDLSMMPLSACNADADCVIRYANCCSCSGTPSDVISVRVDAESAVEQLLCDGGGCPLDCAPRMDPGFAAVCDATTHHCRALAAR